MVAFKIKTKLDAGFSIYLAETAGKAKTQAVMSMRDAYSQATYSWVTSCVRAPGFDCYAHYGPGCVAWSHGNENWQIDIGNWFGVNEPRPQSLS